MVGEEALELIEETELMQERRDLFSQKLEELGKGCRQLLRLSWSGKSMEEIAGLLDISYGYIRKKKSNCMKKLITLVKQSSAYNSLKW